MNRCEWVIAAKWPVSSSPKLWNIFELLVFSDKYTFLTANLLFFAFYLFTDYRCPVRTESLPRHYRCPVHIYLGNTDVLSVMQAYLDTTDVLSVRSGSLPGDNRCPILCTLVETYLLGVSGSTCWRSSQTSLRLKPFGRLMTSSLIYNIWKFE